MLGAFGIFMEGNNFFVDVLWILKHCEVPKDHRVYLSLGYLALICSVLFRFVLPIGAIICACVRQSPLSMHPVPLAALFLAVVFFSAINIWVTYRSVVKLKKIQKARKVTRLETIVKYKSPDLINMPSSLRNILPTSSPLVDVLAQRNSTCGATSSVSEYNNKFNEHVEKTQKTPFTMGLLMKYKDEQEQEKENDLDFIQRRDRYLHPRLERPCSHSSSTSSTCFIEGVGPEGDEGSGSRSACRSQEVGSRRSDAVNINVHLHNNSDNEETEFEEIPLSSV